MIQTGLDKFLADAKRYKGRRIGLIANQTSVTRDLQYGWRRMRECGLDLRLVFTPEHGIFGAEQDQVPVGAEPPVGCATVSLYGNSYDSLIPDRGCLDDIDCVLFDIQDIGARYYTYVNTMALFMEAISGTGIEMIVLDRPNPLGGVETEGPLLQQGFESFVGILPVCVRHGLTPAECAALYREEKKLDLPLSVIAMDGWRRSMSFEDCGLPWVPPSPNMPDTLTAIVYPGQCLFEGLSISEGRGTTRPFLNIGAPFIDAFRFANHCNALSLPGIAFRPVYYRPTFHKFSGQVIGGIYLHITDSTAFRPFRTSIAIIRELCQCYPEQIAFLHDAYEFNSVHPAFDLLAGNARIREMLLAGSRTQDIIETWAQDEQRYALYKERYHIYEP